MTTLPIIPITHSDSTNFPGSSYYKEVPSSDTRKYMTTTEIDNIDYAGSGTTSTPNTENINGEYPLKSSTEYNVLARLKVNDSRLDSDFQGDVIYNLRTISFANDFSWDPFKFASSFFNIHVNKHQLALKTQITSTGNSRQTLFLLHTYQYVYNSVNYTIGHAGYYQINKTEMRFIFYVNFGYLDTSDDTTTDLDENDDRSTINSTYGRIYIGSNTVTTKRGLLENGTRRLQTGLLYDLVSTTIDVYITYEDDSDVEILVGHFTSEDAELYNNVHFFERDTTDSTYPERLFLKTLNVHQDNDDTNDHYTTSSTASEIYTHSSYGQFIHFNSKNIATASATTMSDTTITNTATADQYQYVMIDTVNVSSNYYSQTVTVTPYFVFKYKVALTINNTNSDITTNLYSVNKISTSGTSVISFDTSRHLLNRTDADVIYTRLPSQTTTSAFSNATNTVNSTFSIINNTLDNNTITNTISNQYIKPVHLTKYEDITNSDVTIGTYTSTYTDYDTSTTQLKIVNASNQNIIHVYLDSYLMVEAEFILHFRNDISESGYDFDITYNLVYIYVSNNNDLSDLRIIPCVLLGGARAVYSDMLAFRFKTSTTFSIGTTENFCDIVVHRITNDGINPLSQFTIIHGFFSYRRFSENSPLINSYLRYPSKYTTKQSYRVIKVIDMRTNIQNYEETVYFYIYSYPDEISDAYTIRLVIDFNSNDDVYRNSLLEGVRSGVMLLPVGVTIYATTQHHINTRENDMEIRHSDILGSNHSVLKIFDTPNFGLLFTLS